MENLTSKTVAQITVTVTVQSTIVIGQLQHEYILHMIKLIIY